MRAEVQVGPPTTPRLVYIKSHWQTNDSLNTKSTPTGVSRHSHSTYASIQFKFQKSNSTLNYAIVELLWKNTIKGQ